MPSFSSCRLCPTRKSRVRLFFGISRNQARPGRWLVVHKQIDWICQETCSIPGNRNVSETSGPDKNTCLDRSRQPSLTWRLPS